MRKIRVLHIAQDDQFFEPVYALFESDERLDNRAILIKDKNFTEPRSIKNVDKVDVLRSESEVKKCIKSNTYDVIYFYSLGFDTWHIIPWIPKDRVMIWWAWGFDLYYSYSRIIPVINIPLYKTITRGIYNKSVKVSILSRLKTVLLTPYYQYLKHYLINRLDYFQPCIHQEYEEMKRYRGFKAKEFYLSSNSNNIVFQPHNRSVEGFVILGHSATYANNHLDVYDAIKGVAKGRKIYIPVSYGSKEYASMLKQKLTDSNVNFMETFMPPADYFSFMNECSYMCNGGMRQHAMGNIWYALRNGIKLFLYRDGVLYKGLDKMGYIINAIEEIDEKSFSAPLSDEDQKHNFSVYVEMIDNRRAIYESAIKEVQMKIENK